MWHINLPTSWNSPRAELCKWGKETRGAFLWDYSGIGILGKDGYRVLLEHIPFSEWTECYSVHSALNSRMNRIRFTRNRQNVCSFGGIILAGNRARPAVPGSQASKTWNGLSSTSELFTVDASSLAQTSMDSSLPSVVLTTEDPLSSCPQKATVAFPK